MTEDNSPLHAFRLIARHGSFTRAGAELGVSASALSQSLAQLETRLGVRLLARTTRRVGLTEAGERLLQRIGPALDEIDAALDALRETRDTPAGRLRLTLPRTAMSHLLAPVLPEFLRAYPEIELELDIENALTDIVAEGYDAGIRLGEALAQDMVALPICAPFRFIIVGAPAYFARHRQPEQPADLHAHPCLRYRYATRGILHRWEFRDADRTFEVAVDGPFICNDSAFLIQAAQAALGLAYVPEPLARDALAQGLLQTTLDAWLPAPEAFYLYLPSRRLIPPKLRVLIEFLRARTEHRTSPIP